MRLESGPPPGPAGPLRKLATLLGLLALLGLGLVFSAVLLGVVAVVGSITWAYLWWKTRALRRQLRDLPLPAEEYRQTGADVEAFEGEVIRVVKTGREPRD